MPAKRESVVKVIAEERIRILYDLAKEAQRTDPGLSVQYVALIRKIGRHYRIRLDRGIRNGLCRKCNSVLIPGASSGVRVVGSKRYKITKCLVCGAETRVHY